jgi:hypothetical protein
MEHKLFGIVGTLVVICAFGTVGCLDYQDARKAECGQLNLDYDTARDVCTRPSKAPASATAPT